MHHPAYSIVIGFRNRDLQRVKNCLRAIDQQSFSSFEVIFVDYGSDESVAKEVQIALVDYPYVRYVYSNTRRRFWNRSHALNTGIRLANASKIIVSDIDLILGAAFLEQVNELSFDNNFYTFGCFYLPKDFEIDFKTIAQRGVHCLQDYVGLCAFSKAAVTAVQGFDEYFMVWGVEDDDFYQRLSWAGWQRHELQASNYKVFHQWHATERPGYPSFWYLTMVDYWQSKTKELPKINNDWGLLVEERPLFNNSSLPEPTMVSVNEATLLYRYNEFSSALKKKNVQPVLLQLKVNYESPPKNRLSLGISVFRNHPTDKQLSLLPKDVQMMHYLIGINRHNMIDYDFEVQDNSMTLRVLL